MEQSETHDAGQPWERDLSVAVVGAGISGLTAAKFLQDRGARVTVFDKGRSPGGRASTRTRGEQRFDHGAQYFTARDERFSRRVETWCRDGVVREWTGRIGVFEHRVIVARESTVRRFVGVPGMGSLAAHLAGELDVITQVTVAEVAPRDGRWLVRSDDDRPLGEYDVVAVAAPPAQARPLIAASRGLTGTVDGMDMQPCWAVLAAFESELEIPFDGIFFGSGTLSWAARNSSKPGRPADEAWVIHTSPQWSIENLETSRDEIADRVLRTFLNAAGMQTAAVHHIEVHRWRYAQASNALNVGCLWDANRRLGVCGDWCAGSRVEGAFLSGTALARRITEWAHGHPGS